MFGQPQASTGFSFGPTSTPAFGAASSTPAFGASSTPAFGAPAASAATGFGATTITPAFGATTSTPAFGASSTTVFNFSSTPALGFGAASSTPAFGASSTPAFGQSAAQPAFGGFGQPAAQQPQQQAQQVPFVRSTQFEQVAPNVQATLQQIQSQISTYDASRLKVQQLPHLQESPASQQGLDAEIQSAWGDLKELSGMMQAHEGGLQDFKEKSNQLLKAADVVSKVFERNKQWRESMIRGEVNVQQHMTLPVMLPGPYLEEAVQGMSQTVAEFSRVLDEVEQVLASSSLQDPTQVDWRTVLPTIVSNMHDYFIAVAAKLERTHTEVERLKPMYLARLREQGIYTDPFERARRQEQLQQQQQQQRPSTAAAAGQQQSYLSAGAQPGGLLALPAPAGGGMFGGQTPAGATPQGTPGIGSFGSPFPASTPLGASPFGGAPNSGLSRSNTGKPKSKKR